MPQKKVTKKTRSESTGALQPKTTAKQPKKKAVKVAVPKAATPKAATKTAPKTVVKKNVVKKVAEKATEKLVQAMTKQKTTQTTEAEERLTQTYLSPKELKHFEEILLKKRLEVLRDLDILRASLTDDNDDESANSSYSMHMADHGTETMDREQRFLFISRDEKYLTYIDKAIERIKNRTYGICAVSGKPIPKDRLEAVPHTAVRIEYKKRP
jgi:DnaK suppressor protein